MKRHRPDTTDQDNLMLFCVPGANSAAAESDVDDVARSGLPLITLTRDSGIRLLVEVGFESRASRCSRRSR